MAVGTPYHVIYKIPVRVTAIVAALTVESSVGLFVRTIIVCRWHLKAMFCDNSKGIYLPKAYKKCLRYHQNQDYLWA